MTNTDTAHDDVWELLREARDVLGDIYADNGRVNLLSWVNAACDCLTRIDTALSQTDKQPDNELADAADSEPSGLAEYLVESQEDRPESGMWHCGPNAAWVTVTHLPTMISARAFDTRHHEARRAAQTCCEMLVEQSRLLKCQFPERILTALRNQTDRKAVLEEAAKVAEAHRFPDGWVGRDGQAIIAQAIRALADKGDA